MDAKKRQVFAGGNTSRCLLLCCHPIDLDADSAGLGAGWISMARQLSKLPCEYSMHFWPLALIFKGSVDI